MFLCMSRFSPPVAWLFLWGLGLFGQPSQPDILWGVACAVGSGVAAGAHADAFNQHTLHAHAHWHHSVCICLLSGSCVGGYVRSGQMSGKAVSMLPDEAVSKPCQVLEQGFGLRACYRLCFLEVWLYIVNCTTLQ